MPSSTEYQLGERSISWEQFFGEDVLAFKGHFPKTKILPGVMLVELALQGGGAYLERRSPGGHAWRLARISSAKFLAPVFPGHQVRCECEFRAEAEGLTMKSVISRGDTTCATVKAVYARTT